MPISRSSRGCGAAAFFRPITRAFDFGPEMTRSYIWPTLLASTRSLGARCSTPSVRSIESTLRLMRTLKLRHASQYEMAYRMQTSVPELMDLSKEPDSIFDMYGP